MKTMTYILNLTLLVVCTQFAFAAGNADTGGKQMYISFEDAQAALPAKEYAEPQNGDGNSGGSRSAPDWQDDPGAYEFTATIAGALVMNDGAQMGDEGDILAAFDESGNVRGIGLMLFPPFGPYQGTPVFEVQLRSNDAGDILSFKYYDASADAILDIEETYTFIINDVIGDVIEPITLNIGSEDLSCPTCEDGTLGAFDCPTGAATFGCDFLWGADLISDLCPATCGTCPEEDVCGVCEGDGSSCTDCAGVVDGDATEDCAGTCNGDAFTDCAGTCTDLSSWIGDGYCDDGTWGVDFVSCGDFNCDNGDCGTELVDGECVYVCSFFDCAGQCADGYESWLGDGWCDGTDMAYGLDFSCYDCDNGDCNDECGVCEGDGIADGACDCDGNVDAGCGCGEAGPSGCDNACGSTLENDDCGVCDGGNASMDDCDVCDGDNGCQAITGLTAIGGLNQVMLQWNYNPNAASYDIYRDGELVGSSDGTYPAFLDGNQGGWGLGFDTEYCYTVSANGPSSDEACATTLPQLQAFLDLDLSLANADVAAVASPFGDLTGDGVVDAVIMVKMVNFFAVNGYQFSFSMDPSIVAAIAAVDGTYIQFAGCVATAMGMGMDQDSAAAYCESAGYSSGLQAQMSTPGSSGTVMGFDMNGTGSIPAGYPGDGGAEGNLLAVIVLNSQYSGTGSEVAVTISDFVISAINPFTGESVTLNACDADLDPLNGCFDVDTFSTPAADCFGIPAGSAANDDCGVCNGGNASMDECGVCDGSGPDAGFDCDGNCIDAAICGTASLSFSNVTSGSADIAYSSNVDLFGFQFTISGVTLTGASSGFGTTSFGAESGVVIAFDLSGASIAAGEGTLASLTFEESASGGTIGLSDVIISGDGGAEISSSGPDAVSVPGCDDADCADVCGGSSADDECGVCGGDGSDNQGCGCGEAGPSGCDNACGSTLEDDACGVCDGDGSDNQGCGCFEPGPSGCDNACGSTLEDDDCGVCGGENASMDDCGICDGDGSSCVYSVVQSMEQAFYSFDSVTLDGAGLVEGDWLIARNGDIIVGVAEWNGAGTEVVVMGEELIDVEGWTCDSGPVNTCGMMMAGQTPQFYVFDSSAPLESIAQYTAADNTQLQNIPAYLGLDYHVGLSLSLATDCNSDLGGASVTSGLCGDCWGGNTGLAENYMDTDDDGVCNDGAANGDDDNCPDTPNTDQADNDEDTLGDLCDDDDDNDGCTDDVDDDQFNYDDDYDSDGTPDDCDDDDDNDGAADDVDSDDNNEFECSDDDGDTCDDCSNGQYDTSDDGWDYDGDGICDDGDDDDDNDGSLDPDDSDDNNEFVCNDDDGDTCDECSSGSYDSANDGPDNEGDGICDDGDDDDDNDGCLDDVDDASFEWDDDYDGDGTPDDCDDDDDNDGALDPDDSDDNNEFECSDDDGDGCDDCSGGSYDTWADGDDFDCDGTCDAGDDTVGGEITLSFSNATETTIEIDYDLSSCQGISGFQFTVEGVDLISATDGNLTVQSANNNVIAFDLSGAQLDPGSGSLASLLFYAELDGAEISLSGVIVGSTGGNEITTYGPGSANIVACTNFDGDDLCDIDVDDDDDNDGSADADDSDDNDPNVCSDDDGDTCDDCSSGTYDTSDDGPDNESDGICDDGDDDDDNDGCLDDVDDASFEWDDDYDSDGTPDDCDDDDDNDGAADDVDSDDNNEFECSYDDADNCDDCSSGTYNTSDDGWDYDGDGLCDDGDPDDDNDGALDDVDSDDNNEFECSDDDNDTCDDCSSGTYDTEGPGGTDGGGDGADNDEDGLCDAGDDDDDNDGCADAIDDEPNTWDDDYDSDGTPDDCDDDDDNDGSLDPDDSDDNNEYECSDDDGDTCDDCSSGTGYDVANDGWDYDGDGACDAGDDDDDNDGALDPDDSDDNNEFVCHDDDGDTCDECVSGTEEPTDNDGWDYDGDGICDDGDDDDDNDGALDENDTEDNNEFVCSDDDADTCDDCSSGTYDTSDDGPDNEGDGICDDGDDDDDNDGCLDDVDDASFEWDDDYDGDGTPDDCDDDDDNDGALDPDDSDDNNEFECSDDDGDGCDDCSGGSYDTWADGDDFDCDGTCDAGDDTVGGEITLSFSGATETTIEIDYDLSSCQGISGFQFTVDGVDLISATDGNLTVQSANNNVIAFDLSGAQLDPGSGSLASLLFYAELDGAEISLSGVIIGSSSGEEIAVSGPDPAAIAACTNFDGDDLCDIDVDDDDDNDGSADADDSDDNDPNVCSDDDGDTCDDCSSGTYDTSDDGPDNDEDGACDAGDNDDDNDGCLDDVDDEPFTYDDDYDSDGTPDDCDDDDDNDGALDPDDSDDNNEYVCSDDDGDSCDDCSSGSYDTSDDGWDYDGDGICDDGDDDDDNDGANDDVDSDDNDPNVCSDDDDDLCDDCSDGSYGLDSDGDDFDADGICDAGDPAAPSVVATIGGPNEVHIGHSHSIHMAQGLAYNIYRDGELVGQSGYGLYTNPAFEAQGGDAGLAYGYVDPDGGWGLEYATEYCYTVTSVNPAGRESNDASTESCSTTLPPSAIGLQVTADPSGAIGGIPNAVYVHMVNLWWVSGFQFDIAFDTDEVAIAALVGFNPTLETTQYVNGTTIGFSMNGNMINPTWLDYGAEGAYTPVLIAAFVFTPTTAEFSNNITVSLDESTWAFADDQAQGLFACDMVTDPFVHFYGCEVSDEFEYSVDCSGEQYSGDGAADLGEGSDGWDYTDQCGECDDNGLTDCYDLSIELHEGANLISFPALPTDVSVGNIFAGTNAVIGEGFAAVYVDGNWIGSLTEVSQDDGYWVKVSEDTDLSLGDADPVSYDADGEVSYDIHYGNNLISYPLTNSQSVADALGDAAANVYALAGEGVAAMYSNDAGAWVGSLAAFEGGHGYWLVATADFSFSFNSNGGTLARNSTSVKEMLEIQQFTSRISEDPAYRVVQSDQQAFFFVNNATIRGEALTTEDLIIAYNGEQVVGSRYWNGEFTDVPAMDAKEGDKISFKVLNSSTGELLDMETDGNIEWSEMGISVINLTDIFLPTEVSLSNAYPNPFNPVTMLTYDVPSDMNVSMGIYDVRGRLVEELVNDMHDQGRYEITWNADQHSSGVYMIKMTAGTAVKVQKIMLVK